MKVKIKCENCPKEIEVESECNCANKNITLHSLDGRLHGLCDDCAKKCYELLISPNFNPGYVNEN